MTVDVLLKPTGDAPIMKKRKWTVERTKKISSVIEFVRKYLKFEPQESLVSSCSWLLLKQTLCICFFRTMVCKRGLSHHVVSVRVYVCPSRSWILSKRINVSSKMFHRRVATPFWFFRTKRRYSEQVGYVEIVILSQYLASSHAVNHSSGKCNTLSCDEPWRVYNTSRW